MAENSNETGQQANSSTNSQTNNEPPEWYKNPPAWLQNPPAQQPAQQSATPPPAHSVGPSRTDLLSTIDAMPDKIVDAIREAFPAQQTNAPTETPAPASETPAEQAPGKKGSFAEWWFGQ